MSDDNFGELIRGIGETTARPRTAEDFWSLPEGPAAGAEFHQYTDADRQRGFIEIHGKRYQVKPALKGITMPVLPQVVAFHSEDDEIVAGVHPDGEYWKLGHYADGRWFRQRRG